MREFNVYQSGLNDLVLFLKENNVKTIALESTGSYWQSLFMILQKNGFEVLLVQGSQTKNLKAKTDVKDAQWIQKLHTLGLLKGSFLPSDMTLRIRTLHRHRQGLIESASAYTNKMQKSLMLMNFRLDVVINDIVGVSGVKIIEAILDGENCGSKLAEYADKRVKRSKVEIADALQGETNSEYMYELRDCYELYNILQERIQNVDNEIEKILQVYTEDIHLDDEVLIKKQLKGKNQPKMDIQRLSKKLLNVDLFAIESISSSTVMSFLSEIGNDIYKFRTAKHFVSWLRLAPNNRVSGGKTISSKTPRGKNKFALALRNAANTIERKKDGLLVSFFRRIAYKKGRAAAITATARKLAVIIWNMIIKKTSYVPIDSHEYQEIIKKNKIHYINKTIEKYKITKDCILVN
ncbi:MAG: IS110 family transposase [Chitinophagales bacterium]